MTKTAIVTEASTFRGVAVATRLAADGFAVVLNSSPAAPGTEDTVAALAAAGAETLATRADLADPADVRHLFETALTHFGRIDVVVSNAGIVSLSPIAGGDIGIFDETLRINLRGAFLVLSEAALHTSQGGRIIAFSSGAVAKNLPSFGPFAASKAGLESLVRVLAKELCWNRVTVNAIAPDHLDGETCLGARTEEELAQLRKWAPHEGPSELHDIVHIVSFLAGPDGGWVSGQVIPVSEGLSFIAAAPTHSHPSSNVPHAA